MVDPVDGNVDAGIGKSRTGRPDGRKDRFSKEVLDAILEAFHRKGGVAWLMRLPNMLFVNLLRCALPKEHKIEGDIRGDFHVWLSSLSKGVPRAIAKGDCQGDADDSQEDEPPDS